MGEGEGTPAPSDERERRDAAASLFLTDATTAATVDFAIEEEEDDTRFLELFLISRFNCVISS